MEARGVWSVYRLRGLGKGQYLQAGERWFIDESPPPSAQGHTQKPSNPSRRR